MKVFDFIQSGFSNQPVFRAMQVKHRDPHFPDFFSRITIDDRSSPFCKHFDAYRTDCAPDGKDQTLGRVEPRDEIFKRNGRRLELKKEWTR